MAAAVANGGAARPESIDKSLFQGICDTRVKAKIVPINTVVDCAAHTTLSGPIVLSCLRRTQRIPRRQQERLSGHKTVVFNRFRRFFRTESKAVRNDGS
jgi:hypothetical protein